MTRRHAFRRNPAAVCCIALAAVAIAGVVLFDAWILGRPPLIEEAPWRDSHSLLRTAIIGAASATGTIALLYVRPPTGRFLPPPRLPARPIASIALAVSGAIAFLPPVILWHSPEQFFRLGDEDGPVETLSALALFGSAFLLGYAAWACARRTGRVRDALIVTGLSMLTLLVGLEEVSWFQRVFGFGTPAFLEGNLQGESNLHNLRTDWAENLYYFVAFCAFSWLPFGVIALGPPSDDSTLARVLPEPWVMVLAAPIAGYNYDMWNIAWVQAALTAALTMLLILAWSAPRAWGWPAMGAVGVTTATQLSFLYLGSDMVRPWGVTEYKECGIACITLVYGATVASRARRQPRRSRRPRFGDS